MEDGQTSFVWSLDQVMNVRRLQARAFVGKDVAAADPEGMAATKRQLWGMLADLGHPFGVEIQAEDLQFHEQEDSATFAIRVDARWNPSTGEVEFRGGPHDGEVARMPNAGHPLYPYEYAERVSIMDRLADDRFPTEPSLPRVSYWLAGWSEHNHRWIYEQRGK